MDLEQLPHTSFLFYINSAGNGLKIKAMRICNWINSIIFLINVTETKHCIHKLQRETKTIRCIAAETRKGTLQAEL